MVADLNMKSVHSDADADRVFATINTQLQTFAIEGTLVSSAVICCHLLSCHRREYE
jgi:hypothetical protein